MMLMFQKRGGITCIVDICEKVRDINGNYHPYKRLPDTMHVLPYYSPPLYYMRLHIGQRIASQIHEHLLPRVDSRLFSRAIYCLRLA